MRLETRITRPAALGALALMVVATALPSPAMAVAGRASAAPRQGADLLTTQPSSTSTAAGRATREVGVRFVTKQSVRVVGLRYVQVRRGSGSPVATIATSGGRQLARVRPHAGRGWRVARFPAPVRLRAGGSYLATVRSQGPACVAGSAFARKHRGGSFTTPRKAGVARRGHHRFRRTGTDYCVRLVLAGSATAGPIWREPTGSAPATGTSTPTGGGTSAPKGAVTAQTTAAASVHNCAAKPSACGYPDATNTGVPAGTALKRVPLDVKKGTGWAYDSRGWVSVTGSGAVLNGLSIAGPIDVTASNVTISNSRITLTGERIGIGLRHTSNVTLSHNEISSPDAGASRLMVAIKDIYGDSKGLKVLGNDIWHTSTGVQVESGLIQGNYIHDMGYKSGDHLNGTTSNGGTTQLTIDRNTVLCNYVQTDAISLFQDFGNQANRTISNNLVAGGVYTIYGGANPGKLATSNIKVLNNRFSRKYYHYSGSAGPITAFNKKASGNAMTGNYWDDNGVTISAP